MLSWTYPAAKHPMDSAFTEGLVLSGIQACPPQAGLHSAALSHTKPCLPVNMTALLRIPKVLILVRPQIPW